MQISSNTSSPASSTTNELNSDIGEKLKDVISSSATEGKESFKISFSVSRQKTTKVVSQNKLISKRDCDEDDGDDDQSRKRGILHLEDGIPVE